MLQTHGPSLCIRCESERYKWSLMHTAHRSAGPGPPHTRLEARAKSGGHTAASLTPSGRLRPSGPGNACRHLRLLGLGVLLTPGGSIGVLTYPACTGHVNTGWAALTD